MPLSYGWPRERVSTRLVCFAEPGMDGLGEDNSQKGDCMFLVILEFAEGKERAAQFLDAHKDWLQQGFADGVFLLAGSLKPNLGGAVWAHGVSRSELEARVDSDPFVAEAVVSARILEFVPSKAGPQLEFLLGD